MTAYEAGTLGKSRLGFKMTKGDLGMGKGTAQGWKEQRARGSCRSSQNLLSVCVLGVKNVVYLILRPC